MTKEADDIGFKVTDKRHFVREGEVDQVQKKCEGIDQNGTPIMSLLGRLLPD